MRRSEDKAEGGAWSGAGIETPSTSPSVEDVRAEAFEVLTVPRYGQRALVLAEEFAPVDAEREIFAAIDGCVRDARLHATMKHSA